MATNTNPFYTYSATAGSSKTLQKPQDGGDNNQWGNYINTDLDEIVSAVNALSDKIADADENTLVDFTATGSAVNHVGITNAAAGSGPTISTAGTDSNVDLNVTPKGTGDSVFTNKIKVDDVIEKTTDHGVEIEGVLVKDSIVKTDDIQEKTTDHGVEIDGVLVKDGDVGLATISSKAGTSVGVTLGTDAGDDFNVGSGKLVVEGDTGNVGIGTTGPATHTHIVKAVSGATPFTNTTLTVESNTNNYISLIAPDDSINAIVFGTASNNVHSSINGFYNSGSPYLNFNTGGTERAKIDASGNLYFNSGLGSVGIAYGCRAWVNFNGTGTVAIREAGNVSSITDNGTGDYTVNLSTNMPDTNYAISGCSQYQNNVGQTLIEGPSDASISSFKIANRSNAGSKFDAVFISVQVFR